MSVSVRVRFAPSPTGYLHVGGARTALFNWLFARHHNGTYLLRIEDTDITRSKQEYVASHLASLQWMGLTADEDIVFQLSSLDVYKKTLAYLLEKEMAYPCFCPPSSWQEAEYVSKEEAADYAKFNCLCRTKTWSPEDLLAPHAVRFKVPETLKRIVFEDLIHDSLLFARDQIDDFVIRRSDGTPTSNFCVVVDDIAMRITHVIRGEHHLSNTPKQILLYQALGAAIPQFAHVPMILSHSGERLDKNDEEVSVEEYRKRGILPEALVNYLVRLGWSHGDQELFTAEELIRVFSLKNVGKKSALFDIKKLEWINGAYLRKSTVTDILRAMNEMEEGTVTVLSHLWTAAQLKDLITLYKERVTSLRELFTSLVELATPPSYLNVSLLDEWKSQNTPSMIDDLLCMLKEMTAELDHLVLMQRCESIVENYQEKLVSLAQPVRLALTGVLAGPGVFELLCVIGKDVALSRLKALRDKLRE